MHINALIGKVLKSINVNVNVDGDDEILFVTVDGKEYNMFHDRDCCEGVYLAEIVGDLRDLISGHPIIIAEEEVHHNDDENNKLKPWHNDDSDTSYTWTFYRIGTKDAVVTLRWYGASNGYYSESVSFEGPQGG